MRVRGQHRYRLVVSAVVGVVLLGGCGSVLPGGAPAPATVGSGGADGGPPGEPPAADPAQGYRPAVQLTFSGLADGPVTDGGVSCTQIDASTYAWTLTGQLGASPLELSFNTNRFRGPGEYRVSGISEGGVLTMKLGSRTAATDGTHGGTFTVDADEEGGSVNADLASPEGMQHVSGTWNCTDD